MDNYPLKPERMRAPNNLSRAEIQKSLDELESKIKTLKGRANATASDSIHTYHEHIAGLEKKRELLASKMANTEDSQGKWQDMRKGLDSLLDDLNNFFK